VEAAASSSGEAYIEIRAGDLRAAERALRTGAEELEAIGDRGFQGTLAVILAQILVEQGQDEEAAAWCQRARQRSGPSDLATLGPLDAVEGLLAARRGDCVEGESLARRGGELLADSDFYLQVAGQRILLAQVLMLCHKPEEARASVREAFAMYEAKGDEPAAARARALLERMDDRTIAGPASSADKEQ
jgi:hypothetical protein